MIRAKRNFCKTARLNMSLARLGKHYSPRTEFKKGLIPWNKGLTSETDERVRKYGKKIGILKLNNKNMLGKHHTEESRKKMRLAHLGKKLPERTRIKMSMSRRGSDNPKWNGGIATKKYPYGFNNILKEKIKTRDSHICQLCGMVENGIEHHVHHIDYDKHNLDFDNLITLCKRCNSKVNDKREQWKEYFQNLVISKKLEMIIK